MGPEGACLLGGGPSLRIGGPRFIGGGGPLEDGPLKKGSLLGGPLIPLGAPLDPRDPLGEKPPRLRGCIDGGPRRADDSN